VPAQALLRHAPIRAFLLSVRASRLKMLGLPEHFLALASGAYIEARALIKTPAT
jgi:hypothetical protein